MPGPASQYYRVGLIVPSSNITVEVEVPAMLNARSISYPAEKFSCHVSRVRMKNVTPSELKTMEQSSKENALALSDAGVDVICYACLVAMMVAGKGCHRTAETELFQTTRENGAPTPVITSAGALLEALSVMQAKKISIITPYMKPLTQVVTDYLAAEGFVVVDSISREISDNLKVGTLHPLSLIDIVEHLNTKEADVIILSACLQMPSLEAIPLVEDKLGKPVISAATAMTYSILRSLNLARFVPNAGKLLSGVY